jgi:hypothetical protein
MNPRGRERVLYFVGGPPAPKGSDRLVDALLFTDDEVGRDGSTPCDRLFMAAVHRGWTRGAGCS